MKRILVLEDDLETLSKIMNKFFEIEREKNIEISVVTFSESTQVEYLNKQKAEFDIILLDRDCKLCGSFHILDFEKFSKSKIIAISSIPDYNEQAKEKGAQYAILKNYEELDKFANSLKKVIIDILSE